MNYIVTKSTKSKGIAAILVFLFGGIGLFYASITGGIIMGVVAPIAIYFFLFLGVMTDTISIVVLVIIFCCLYYIICLIWALRAVGNYNRKIIAESSYYQNPSQGDDTTINNDKQERKSNLWIWILVLLLLSSIIFILYYKGIIFETSQPIKGEKDLKPIPAEILTPKRSKEELKYYDDKKLSRNIFKDADKLAWKITLFLEEADVIGRKMKEEREERYFVFYDKKIYMILNGYIMKTWHETRHHFEDEVEITETKEGDVFSIFGSIQIDYKTGGTIHYECDQVPIKNVYINNEFLK